MIDWAPRAMAFMPLEHTLLMVVHTTLSGKPAHASREYSPLSRPYARIFDRRRVAELVARRWEE